MSRIKTLRIPFSKPAVGMDEFRAIERVLKSGHLTTGVVTDEFEKRFASYVGATYAVFLNSCTSALKLSLLWKKKELNLDRPPRVLVPSLTFCATVNEVIEAGCVPVFGDVDRETLCLKQTGKEEVDIILPVHLGGNQAQVEGEHVIYDSAHLIENGCHKPETISCYSFYPTKNMITGEGGMLCTDDVKMYNWLLMARHHGRAKAVGDADVKFISGKYNNTDIAAAIGYEQLKKLNGFNWRRNETVKTYNDAFGYDWHGNHLYIVRVSHRDKFMKKMKAAGIGASIHFNPVHKMTAYKEYDVSLPVTERVTKQIVSLPLFPTLTTFETDYICEKVKETNLLLPLSV